MKRIWILLILLIPLLGCTSNLPIQEESKFEIITWNSEKVSGNKHAILMRSHLFDKNNNYLVDKYINNDMTQIARLLCHKGYKVWYTPTISGLQDILAKIKATSNDETQTFFAYSGKGDSKGLRLYGQYVTDSQLMIPANVTLTPKKLLSALAEINGKKTVLLNACEAGIFPDYASSFRFNSKPFDGVIIASCAVGYLTTPYEGTGTTAVFATFLEHYSNNLDNVIDLSKMDIDTVGGWWYNLLHKISNRIDRLNNHLIKPISYDTVVYRGGSFKL